MARTGPWFSAFLVILFAVLPAAAQEDERITRLETKLDELLRQANAIRLELDALKGVSSEVAVTDLTAVEVTTSEVPAAPAAAKALNPDISVVGTFISHAGDNFEERAPIALDEVEVAYEAFIDPYAKGRFFIAVTPEEVDVEEGYAQFVTLPWGLTAKAGKSKATFGKANLWHTHTRPWIDQPMMLTRFLGEEGLADVGLSVSKSIDNPFGAFVEATGEVYSGDAEGTFGRASNNDLLYNTHLKFFRDLGENSNVEVGTSWARGTLPESEGHNRLAGVDVTYRWKPLSRAIYNSFVARVEALANERSDFDRTLYGYYASADYQVARRWFVGARVDRADRFFEDDRFRDHGISGTITFWPSEFSQLRGQYRRTKFGNGPTFDEILFQLQFAIGAHGAHVF
ncbi:MAG TPA: hypothetical protein VGQ36_13455 [Thermoanaerobaculia bacterium]|jgi:hypothetical protein|nr:hypothetical protein [Thermoanaerobaculia bacterium]